MKRSKKILFFTVLVLIAALWIWRPPAKYNPSRVDPRLCALDEPFCRVTPYYFYDGGSVGVEIVDKNNKMVRIAIPAHLGETNQYTRFYIGAIHDSNPDAQEIMDATDSRPFVEAMLVKYSDGEATTDLVIFSLRRRTSDFLRCIIHKLRGDFSTEGPV